MLLHLRDDNERRTRRRPRMAAAIRTLPDQLRRSITWDQGVEMADHATLQRRDRRRPSTSATPTRRGNEGPTRTPTGCLRQYFPKGTDLSIHGPDVLQAAADSLNGRPRKTLDWKTPTEALNELLLR